MAYDPVAFKNTKHIMRAAEFLRDLVRREVVTLTHMRGAIMLADLLTKAVARPLFIDLLRLLDDYALHARPSSSSDELVIAVLNVLTVSRLDVDSRDARP